MIKNTLPQKPTVDQINRSGQEFGQMLIDNSTPEERRYIAEYGSHILANMPPTSGLTMRFLRELADLAPRMNGYSVAVARMSLYQNSISNLQNAIALYVACVVQSQNSISDSEIGNINCRNLKGVS
jgi:hypothetical protein